MKNKWIKMYLDIAERIAQESHAVRLKVGAVFVSPEGVMSTGINGMPAGGTNECEYKIITGVAMASHSTGYYQTYELKTKPECSHAEEQLFSKLMRQGVSTKDGSMFISHEPCLNCAKIIVGSGVKEVIFRHSYTGSNGTGVEWLNMNNVTCLKEYQ